MFVLSLDAKFLYHRARAFCEEESQLQETVHDDFDEQLVADHLRAINSDLQIPLCFVAARPLVVLVQFEDLAETLGTVELLDVWLVGVVFDHLQNQFLHGSPVELLRRGDHLGDGLSHFCLLGL